LETLDAFQDNCRQRHQQPVVDRRDAEEELVENHHLHCSAAPLAYTTPQQDQEAAQAEQATEPTAEPAAVAIMTTTLQDEQLQAQQQASRAVRIHRTHRPCSCPHAHPFELAEVIRNRHLNPRKACADWQKGKRVCPDCRFLVNMENHHLRCSAAALHETSADITQPQEDQENTNPPAAATAALQDEQLALLGEIVTMIHQTTTRDARRNQVVHRTLAQRMNEFHDADQQQLQQMANTLGAIITEQQRMNEQLQARQQASRPVRIHHIAPIIPRTPIRRRTLTTRYDLAGASVWTGDVLSRISRGRLVSAAAGAAVTLVAL